MLRTKNLITKLLYSLEVFMDVYGVSLNSSTSKMAGDAIYIGHQLERSVCSRWGISANTVSSTDEGVSV